jgi:hypothetical protein
MSPARKEIEGRDLLIKKPAQVYPERASFNNPGDFLLSHTVSRAVPSAPAGLTSVFGMGTGVTLPTKSPENFFGSGDPAGVLKSSEAHGASRARVRATEP